MAKIIIKNFRAIDYAEIEIKPFTVIIGEQASGKSTISKLVYFFQTMSNDMSKIIIKYLSERLHQNVNLKFDTINFEEIRENCLKLMIIEQKRKFHDFFNSTKEEDFNISFDEPDFLVQLKTDGKISVDIFINKNPFIPT